jgi:hypothetical protein
MKPTPHHREPPPFIEALEDRRLLAAAPAVNGLNATYFNNADLTGTTVQRIDSNIDFEFATDSPADGIDPTTYSVRWSGRIRPKRTGRYTFYTQTDDGVRLFVNNLRIINKFKAQPLTQYQASINLTSGKFYDIRVEYFNSDDNGEAHLSWSGPGITKQIISSAEYFQIATTPNPNPTISPPSNLRVTAHSQTTLSLAWNAPGGSVAAAGYDVLRNGQLVATRPAGQTSFADTGLTADTQYIYDVKAFDSSGSRSIATRLTTRTDPVPAPVPTTGLQALLFNNIAFIDPAVVTRIDPNINFNFGLKSPAVGINADGFSIRWRGLITAPKTERFTFFTNVDDGVRLSVNGSSIISRGEARGFNRFSGAVNLTAGQPVDFLLEYIDRTGAALIQLSWSSPSTPLQVVPTAVFTPPADAVAPAIPANFTASPISPFAIQLSWDTVPGANVYTIQRSFTGIDSWTQVFVADGTQSGVTDVGLGPSTTYFYRIRARNNAGDSDFSAVIDATTKSQG